MEIVDPKKWLTKGQRQKIRSYLQTEPFHAQTILNLIHYRPNEGSYKHCEIKDTQLLFTEIDPRDQLRRKLSMKLKSARGTRIHHRLESWKKYYDLINIPRLQGISIPTPKDVIKNKDVFENIRNIDQSGWMKDYIDQCFQDETDLSA